MPQLCLDAYAAARGLAYYNCCQQEGRVIKPGEVDRSIPAKMLNKLDSDADRAFMHTVLSGSRMDKEVMKQKGWISDCKCDYCGFQTQSLDHILWFSYIFAICSCSMLRACVNVIRIRF